MPCPLAVNLFPLPQTLVTVNLLSVSVDLSILDISSEWSSTICGLLSVAAFTYHNVFKGHTVASISTSFLFMTVEKLSEQ